MSDSSPPVGLKMCEPCALVTGASSGIGEAFARRFAVDGLDLILVARRRDRLEEIAGELRSDHGVRVEVIPADLATEDGVGVVENRIGVCRGMRLLVNNAGFGTSGLFAEIDPGPQLGMIHVHVTAAVRLTRAILPGMIERGRGSIINVASVAAWWPVRNGAIYCATKSFLVVFTRSLARELDGTGVRVQALCPGFTRTAFHSTPEFAHVDTSASPDWLWLPADRVVDESLRDLDRNREICVPSRRYRWLLRALRTPGVLPLLRAGRNRWHRRNESARSAASATPDGKDEAR